MGSGPRTSPCALHCNTSGLCRRLGPIDVDIHGFTWSREIESSLSSTRCLPSSSSSSSSSKADLPAPVRIPPNAAFPPARENGVDATAVANTLAEDGAPNDAKSVTTFRGGEDGGASLGDAGVFGTGRDEAP